MKKTKIVCTLGPASWGEDILSKLVDAGMNVARENGAFADETELDRIEQTVRRVSGEVALMLDVKGHEIRLNRFGDPIHVEPGQIVEIGNSDQYKVFPITFPEMYRDLRVGAKLLIDDGAVELVVEEIVGEVVKAKVVSGSEIKEGKSINTPGTVISNPALTDRDRQQIAHCKAKGWEFVAASFMRSKADAELVKAELTGSDMQLIAKIEDGEGYKNIDEILEVADGLMVARGDLGVEVPIEKLPLMQKELIHKANHAGKIVITATEMLDSMIDEPQPTRAEVTDVANAIIDGTDAIMLSGETSAGKYPVEAVQTMSKIALEVEANLGPNVDEYRQINEQEPNVAMSVAAADVMLEMGSSLAAAIIVSRTGRLATLLGRYALSQPMYAFVGTDMFRRQLSIAHGIVQAFTYQGGQVDRDEAIASLLNEIRTRTPLQPGQKVLIIADELSAEDYFPKVFEVATV